MGFWEDLLKIDGARQTRQIVCLTPVRDEDWCIESFFEAASCWADHILVSDQSSTDFLLQIASRFSKVVVIRNGSKDFNEAENRKWLLERGRELFGPSVFISIDADERVSGEILDKNAREALASLEPGTGILAPFANLKSSGEFWRVKLDPIGFVDDGREPDTNDLVHFPRTCFSTFPKILDSGLHLIHLQYLDEQRFSSKVVWYKLFEITKLGRRNPIWLYRRYHHPEAIRRRDLRPLPDEWIEPYRKFGIEPLRIIESKRYWWSSDLAAMKDELTPAELSLFDLRDHSLEANRRHGFRVRLLYSYLESTQRWFRPSKVNPIFLALYAIDVGLSAIFFRMTAST